MKYIYTSIILLFLSAFSYSQTDTLIVSVTTTPAIDGNCNGTATAVIEWGTPPYSFAWVGAPAGGTQTITNFCPGTYNLMVTDGNANMASAVFTIMDSIVNGIPADTLLIVNLTTVNDFSGDCDGAAQITILNGTEPFSVEWGNGATGLSITNLCTGIYSYTVTDANGLIASESFLIVDSSSYYDGGNYEDSLPTGDLDGGLNENCFFSYSEIDSVWASDLEFYGEDYVIITWAVYISDSIVYVTDTAYWNGETGVYETVSSFYCPEKSTNQFAQFRDRVYIGEGSLSIDEDLSNSTIIYPNPFNESITISFENHGDYDIALTDASGRLIFEKNVKGNSELLEASGLKAGVYFVSVSNGADTFVKKLVKN